MKNLTEYTSYADAQKHWDTKKLWEMVDGNLDNFNIAHECIDRHATDRDRTAITIIHADGDDELLTFSDISETSSQFAHYLCAQGVKAGDRVAIMLEPSRAFYVTLFGII